MWQPQPSFRTKFSLYSHGLIIPIMDNCPVLSFLALFLELEVFLKDRGKTVSFQHASLVHDGILGCRQIFKVVQQRDIVSWRGQKKHPVGIFKKKSFLGSKGIWFCLSVHTFNLRRMQSTPIFLKGQMKWNKTVNSCKITVNIYIAN